jgi:hypothetical protein
MSNGTFEIELRMFGLRREDQAKVDQALHNALTSRWFFDVLDDRHDCVMCTGTLHDKADGQAVVLTRVYTLKEDGNVDS